MRTPFLLCIVFSIINLAASSQQKIHISGSVTNAVKMPVAGATVYLLNTSYVTNTDSLGNFTMKDLQAGKYTVQISSIGYAIFNSDIAVKTGTPSFHFTLAGDAVQLDAVTVAAQKREEDLQKIPLSATVLSARQVQEYRLWNSKELTGIVPNLYSANSGDDRNVVSIRGIATTSYDPAVTTYIDGVNQFSLDTYIAQLSDIERIEVLRGPQGTLYGRNAMGGVINIITKQPTNKASGFAELSAGNYKQLRVSAGIRIPVIKNKIFAGAAITYNQRDGFYTNDFNQRAFDKQKTGTGNYYLKYLASPRLSLTLNAKHQTSHNDGAFPLVNGVEESFSNPFHLNQDAVAKMIDKTFNMSLVASYTGRALNFTSQTAYQFNHRYYEKPLDGDFSALDGISIINNYGGGWNKVKVVTQEFKFSSPASATKLKWTAGSYLFYQDNPTKQAVHFGKDAALFGAPDIDFSIVSSTKAKSYGLAFFAQSSYAITSKLNIIAGLRYDLEKKKYNVLGEYQKDPDPVTLFETRPDTSASARFHAFSPKLGLSYNLSRHNDAFVTYSRGYRAGGLTSLSSDPSQPPLYPYKPEYSNNMELGIKNNLWNNRLQLNVTAFVTWVTDAQVPTLVLPDAVTITKNAGRLTSKGIELELAARPVKGLQADYNFGYTHAVYKNLKLSQNGAAANLDGKKQIFTPQATSMLALQYTYNLGGKMQFSITGRGEWMYLGKQYFDLSNNISQSDYSLLNIRFGISSKYAALMFWARNLGDKRYIAYAYDFGAIHLGDPKTYGLTLSTRF